MTDVLETRSMNLNVRVSPLMKLRLTDKAQKMGVNITDYIYVAIAGYESMGNNGQTVDTEKARLKQQVKELQTTLSRYDSLLKPIADNLIGHEVLDENKQKISINNKFDVLKLILSNFKTEKK